MRLAYFALCASLFLASCINMPGRVSTDLDWQHRSAQLSAISHWKATGKLAIRTNDKSESASLVWNQAGNMTHILLSGPMGLAATSIESDREQLRVKRDGATRTFDISSREAITEGIGWDLPLQALPYWLRGLPAPSPDQKEQTPDQIVEQGLLRQVKQLGWTVTYESYGQFEQFALPTRLKIERNGTRARMIIYNWTNFSS